MDLVFVRHGRSVSNNSGVISGAGLDAPLSDDGIDYAKQVAEVLDKSEFADVYASPLIRARQTAEILVDGHHEINFDKRLEEIHFGDWEAQDPDPLRAQYPDAFDYVGMINANYVKYAKNAESYDDIVARVKNFIDEMKEKYPDGKILAVCHGMTIRAAFAAIFGNDIYEYAAVDNVTINHIHLDQNDQFRPRVMAYNKKLV